MMLATPQKIAPLGRRRRRLTTNGAAELIATALG
jgi:hypothetical protein